jgi:DNA-binding CsgD family transcriptional regulator
MNTRGRPRHPEVLTPRQQEVLALLRRGLTNEEIARELNISADGVKFHVSDILRRLHVESRHEAAAWQPEPARPRWALLLAPIAAIKKLHLGALGYAAAAVITGGAAIGVALLVWGVVRTSDPGAQEQLKTVILVNTKSEVASRVVEDSNQNGVSGEGDVLTSAAAMSLIPWSDPTKEIVLVTAKDGAFSFTDLPAGAYTIRLAWPTGFVGNVTADDLPFILRAAFQVMTDGEVVVPSPFPETWPGLPLEKFDPVHDRTLLGPLPATILVKYIDPRLSAILPGTSGRAYVGTVDVAAALIAQSTPPPTSEPLARWASAEFKVELSIPASWRPDDTYSFDGVVTRYSDQTGPNGRFASVGAVSAPGLDYAVDSTAHHILRPYGANPVIRDLSIPAGAAKLILPDPASPELNEAAVLLLYPVPVQFGSSFFQFFELHAQPQDIVAIAESLRLAP